MGKLTKSLKTALATHISTLIKSEENPDFKKMYKAYLKQIKYVS